jgi:hypothetical protein
MGQTGATLYVCHFKRIESWIGTKNLVFSSGNNVSTLFYSGNNVSTLFYSGYNVSTLFYSGNNVSTLFYSGYNVSTLFYSGYNVSTLFGNQQKRSLTYRKRCTHQTHYHFSNMSPVIMPFHSNT